MRQFVSSMVFDATICRFVFYKGNYTNFATSKQRKQNAVGSPVIDIGLFIRLL
jgi:hypothetical protein